jgi:hypothetical protein
MTSTGEDMPSPTAWERCVARCVSCGAVIEGYDGAEVPCAVCRHVTTLRPRAEFARGRGVTVGPQTAALKAQDVRPPQRPERIAFLFEGNVIPSHREEEALVAWLGARDRASGKDVAAGEELGWLTAALAHALEQRGDILGARGLFEGALAASPVPRQRAALLGRLSRLAMRQGDLDAADAWAACFEGVGDLESDSELRVSLAAIATAREDWTEVTRLLGTAPGEIAIVNHLDVLAFLLRLNALERSGRLDLATRELRAAVSSGPQARDALQLIAGGYHRTPLCPESLQAALAAREHRARASAGGGSIALGALLIAVSIIPTVALTYIALTTPGAPSFMPGVGLVFVFIFGSWGLKVLRKGLRERDIAARGVTATARVLGAERTGMRVNSVPEMRIHLEVLLDPPVRSKLQMLVDLGSQHLLTPGTELRVRIDPARPDYAILDA